MISFDELKSFFIEMNEKISDAEIKRIIDDLT